MCPPHTPSPSLVSPPPSPSHVSPPGCLPACLQAGLVRGVDTSLAALLSRLPHLRKLSMEASDGGAAGEVVTCVCVCVYVGGGVGGSCHIALAPCIMCVGGSCLMHHAIMYVGVSCHMPHASCVWGGELPHASCLMCVWGG